jgi:hypothetical protein
MRLPRTGGPRRSTIAFVPLRCGAFLCNLQRGRERHASYVACRRLIPRFAASPAGVRLRAPRIQTPSRNSSGSASPASSVSSALAYGERFDWRFGCLACASKHGQIARTSANSSVA